MAEEFVEGWLVAQVLGEGSYGEVRLLVNARTGASVALKSVRSESAGSGGAAREAALHRALRHKHVLRCLGERSHGALHYMFLEYAQGGELFDKIEPDVGMPEHAARRYWNQLLEGIQYLHSRGVAHRDIKPENLLLDHDDNIKISDFGMATLFRHGGRERLVSRVCGTLPYAAPEVLSGRPHRAAPADLWAAAVVLLAMLAGELPWEKADNECQSFASWCNGVTTSRVWTKLNPVALALMKRALLPDPKRRYNMEELLQHPWTVIRVDETDAGTSEDGIGDEEKSWRLESFVVMVLWRFSSHDVLNAHKARLPKHCPALLHLPTATNEDQLQKRIALQGDEKYAINQEPQSSRQVQLTDSTEMMEESVFSSHNTDREKSLENTATVSNAPELGSSTVIIVLLNAPLLLYLKKT